MAQTAEQKKARSAEKRAAQKASKAADSDSDSEPEPEEEEEVESARSKAKKAKGKAAFMGLARKVVALVPLAIVLSQSPFMLKPRMPGVNRGKMVPLQLAAAGAVHWAAESPMALRRPQIKRWVNETGRVLFTPAEYIKAQSSKRAMPNEKTVASAYKKAKKAFPRAVDGDAHVLEMLKPPMPNVPLLGAYVLVFGALLAPLIFGAEYLVVVGCGAIMHGCRGYGMEPQPELYATGVIAVLVGIMGDAATVKPEAAVAKQPRARRK